MDTPADPFMGEKRAWTCGWGVGFGRGAGCALRRPCRLTEVRARRPTEGRRAPGKEMRRTRTIVRRLIAGWQSCYRPTRTGSARVVFTSAWRANCPRRRAYQREEAKGRSVATRRALPNLSLPFWHDGAGIGFTGGRERALRVGFEQEPSQTSPMMPGVLFSPHSPLRLGLSTPGGIFQYIHPYCGRLFFYLQKILKCRRGKPLPTRSWLLTQ